MSLTRARLELTNGDILSGHVEISGTEVNDHAVRFITTAGVESLVPWGAILCLTYLKD